MSYTVRLVDAEKTRVLPAITPNYTHGTTVSFDPRTMELLPNPECALSITYNYGKHYDDVFGPKGIDVIHDMPAREATPLFVAGVQQLGSKPSSNYWEATPGNAGHALRILLGFALDHPDGVFTIDQHPEYIHDED